MSAPTTSGRRAWWLVAATPIIWWLTHYLAVIPHEYSHSFMAWFTGIKANPLIIDWGGTSIHNILTLGSIDEEVDYQTAFSSGHAAGAVVTAMAGSVIGNGVPYLIVRFFMRRPSATARPWLIYTLFWYLVHCVGNFYDYVPLRTFASDDDVNNVVLGTGWSRYWILGLAGYLTLWAIVDLFRKAMPWTLGAAGFGPLRVARATVLILSTLTLFALYALPALGQPDPVSEFMGRVSFIAIPAVLLASWRRNVVAKLPLPPGQDEESDGGSASAGHAEEPTRGPTSTGHHGLAAVTADN